MKKYISIPHRFRLYYFLKYAAIGVLAPYMALYFTERGLSGIEMGLVLGMQPLVKMFIQPLFSLVGDIYHANRVIMVLSSLATSLSVMALYLTDMFFPILLIMAAFSALDTPAEPIVNALALEHLDQQDRAEDFGAYRLWGSVGFALGSFVMGWLATGPILLQLPLAYAIICLFVTVLTFFIPVDGARNPSLTWMEGLRILPQRPALAIFLVGTVMVAAAMNITVQYLAFFMEDLHAAGWLIGLTIAIQALIEVPLMGGTPRIIRRLGLKSALLLGVAVMPLRYIFFYFIHNAWLVMPTQIFHSMSVVSMQVVAIPFIDRLVPHEWRSTGQGLLSTAFRGVGPGLGLMLSGIIFDSWGIMGVWGICLLFSFLGAIAVDISLRQPAARRALQKSGAAG